MEHEAKGHVPYEGADGRKIAPFSMVSVKRPSDEWGIGERLVFLDEIKNCPGHCIVVNQHGKLFPMSNTSDFETC